MGSFQLSVFSCQFDQSQNPINIEILIYLAFLKYRQFTTLKQMNWREVSVKKIFIHIEGQYGLDIL